LFAILQSAAAGGAGLGIVTGVVQGAGAVAAGAGATVVGAAAVLALMNLTGSRYCLVDGWIRALFDFSELKDGYRIVINKVQCFSYKLESVCDQVDVGS
jgi:hypothetical protein